MALKISGSLCPLEVRVVRFNKKMKIDDITYVSICGLQKTIIQSNNITHLNGGKPQSNIYAMVPTDQTSHDLSYLPFRSSGDM